MSWIEVRSGGCDDVTVKWTLYAFCKRIDPLKRDWPVRNFISKSMVSMMKSCVGHFEKMLSLTLPLDPRIQWWVNPDLIYKLKNKQLSGFNHESLFDPNSSHIESPSNSAMKGLKGYLTLQKATPSPRQIKGAVGTVISILNWLEQHSKLGKHAHADVEGAESTPSRCPRGKVNSTVNPSFMYRRIPRLWRTLHPFEAEKGTVVMDVDGG